MAVCVCYCIGNESILQIIWKHFWAHSCARLCAVFYEHFTCFAQQKGPFYCTLHCTCFTLCIWANTIIYCNNLYWAQVSIYTVYLFRMLGFICVYTLWLYIFLSRNIQELSGFIDSLDILWHFLTVLVTVVSKLLFIETAFTESKLPVLFLFLRMRNVCSS